MTRPYSRYSTSELKALYEASQDDLNVLEGILHELGFREKKGARTLIVQVAQRIADLRNDDEEDVFKDALHDDEDSEFGAVEENKGTKVDEGGQPSGGAWSPGLFGAASQDFELPPDDIQRPNNLSRIRPPGTSGLPSAYQKTLD